MKAFLCKREKRSFLPRSIYIVLQHMLRKFVKKRM